MRIKVLPFVVFLSAFACTLKQDVKATSDNSKEVIGIINIDSIPVITFISKTNAPKIIAAGKPEVHQNPNSDGLGVPSFTTYTSDQGLALDAINSSCIDRFGNLWFGTSGGGISRYDGKSFTNFTTSQGLANNTVFSIEEDKSGNLWFGTRGGGVSRYDGKSFTNFTTAQGLADNVVWSIAEDKSGNLWFGTDGGGISRYDGKSFTNFTMAQGLAGNIVRSTAEDKLGNLWFGTDDGVSRYDGKSFNNFTTAQGLTDNIVRNIAEDKSGNLWFGTDGGVSRYDGKSFTNFTTVQGLADNVVWSITEDKSGNLWFGTNGGGVSRYDGKTFTNFTTAQGLANNIVRSIAEDKSGNLWFGTDRGVSRYDGKSFTNFTTAQGLADNVVWSIAEDKSGNLWFGTQGGASRYDGKSFINITTAQGLANNVIRSIKEDKSGNLWFATHGGVSKYDGKSFTNFTIVQGLANNVVYSLAEDKSGNLWFGTRNGGMSRYDGKSFTNFTTPQGLANKVVYSITEDKSGNLWFGTSDGLSVLVMDRLEKLAKGNEKVKESKGEHNNLFTTYTTGNGLPDNFVTQVLEGEGGKIYVGTNRGICELFPSHQSGGKPKVGLIFNSSTGYSVKDVNVGQNTLYKDSKGIIWIATGADKTALARFDPAAVRRNPEPPTVLIQSIRINDEAIDWYTLEKNKDDSLVKTQLEIMTHGQVLLPVERDSIRKIFAGVRFDSISKFYPLPQNLVLPHQFNHLTFEFAAVEPSRPFLVKYQYMLEGYDKQWSPATNKTDVSFGNIREGTYIFHLKAQSPDGVWNEISYSFKVLPPWHRSWWAYTLYALLFLMVLWGFVIWRLKTLKREKLLLEEKVVIRTRQLREEKEKVENALTELETTQTQLIQREKMASLGELTAGIAHEIQNPLNFVNNFSEVNAEMIDEATEEIDKGNITEVKNILSDIKDNSERINHHGKRADTIVKGMLQHSRTSSGQKELTDINALCDEYLRLAYHGLRAKDKSFNATLRTDFDETIGNINIVPQDIGRVILNLINNAFYAVDEKRRAPQPPKGGVEYEPTVTVSTKRLDSPSGPARAGTDGDGGKVEIKVADNGNGIPQKILDKIFQPFFTTKPTGQGTGLGLSLAYDIVKAHSGEITVGTKDGEGSEFIILLSLSKL